MDEITCDLYWWRAANRVWIGFVLALWFLAPQPALAAPQVEWRLVSSPNQPVGTPVAWEVTPADGQSGETLVYRYTVRGPQGVWSILRDFRDTPVFAWTTLYEGEYVIRVTAKDTVTGETTDMDLPYTFTPRVTGSPPQVSRTRHPLVAIYSTRSCQSSSGAVRVRFRDRAGLFWNHTPWMPCRVGASINLYVAGMRAESVYTIQEELFSGISLNRGPMLQFVTGALPVNFPVTEPILPADQNSSLAEGILLQSPGLTPGSSNAPFATDLAGRVIWYNPLMALVPQTGAFMYRPFPGGTMIAAGDSEEISQLLRESDLAGNIVRETNVQAVSDQLAAIGQDPIRGFHHDMIRLPNGHILALAFVERLMEDVQGVEGPVDVLGDMIIDLNENMQVAWVWNSFEHLDIQRAALMGELCITRIFCAPLKYRPIAKDWTHGNTLDYIPADGNLLLSLRHQDWVLKLNYADGAGDGVILWRFGAQGDFTAISDDPWPWFSHQHQTHYIGLDRIIVLDNGNLRCALMPAPCNSRGQVWKLDETARTATLELNVDLGLFSQAFGSAALLSNGNYHFSTANLQTSVSESI
jgi:hypothetical protein